MSRRSSMTAVELGSSSGTHCAPYKTRHELARDVAYFNTLRRAQSFGKWPRRSGRNRAADVDKAEHDEVEDDDALQIIAEEEDKEKAATRAQADALHAINDDVDMVHRRIRTQLSCDTRAAVRGGIAPYKPSNDGKRECTESDDGGTVRSEKSGVVGGGTAALSATQSAMV